MDILQLIKERKTIRKYQDKPIPKNVLDKIIEAGIWGPSLTASGIQPWKFFIIREKKIKTKIVDILVKASKKIGVPGSLFLTSSSTTISNAQTVILIYSTSPLVNWAKRIKKCLKLAQSSEIAAISAAIQNMILTAYTLGVASCWLGVPLLCAEEINKLFDANDELVSVLTLGYPAQEGKRSPRKPISETVKYF